MTPRPFAPPLAPKKRAPRGLLELGAAALCVWAAAYHTPAGALVRLAVSKATGKPSSARPLLAYYSGGTWDAEAPVFPLGAVGVPHGPRLLLPVDQAALAPLPAVARGVLLTWSALPVAEQRPLVALAARQKLPLGAAADDARTQEQLAAVLEREAKELGSVDAAVLAAFAGHDSARFAARRATAEGRPASLERLAPWLPNGSGAPLSSASKALALGTAYALAWPLEVPARISSPFGYRTHPLTGARQLHSGLDLAVPERTLVRAVADGVVRRASEDALNGRVVIVDHGHGVSSAYCHNSELAVATGQVVKAGELLARSGNTGRSTGPHLHYQVELSRTPVDPLLFRPPPQALASARRGPRPAASRDL